MPSSKVTSGPEFLVMLDDGPPDPASLIFGGPKADVADPRDDDWDEALREMKLVIVCSGGRNMNAPKLTLGPFDFDPFAEPLRGKGLDEDVIRSIYTATQGSPLAIRILRELDEDERRMFSGASTEEAIFRLLMTMGRSKDNTKIT